MHSFAAQSSQRMILLQQIRYFFVQLHGPRMGHEIFITQFFHLRNEWVKISERFLPSLLYKVTNADSTSDSCTFSMAHNFLSRKCR